MASLSQKIIGQEAWTMAPREAKGLAYGLSGQ